MAHIDNVKETFMRFTDDLKEEVEKCRTPEERASAFKTWAEDTWTFIEGELQDEQREAASRQTEAG